MLKGISIEMRNARWHKAHERKRLKREAHNKALGGNYHLNRHSIIDFATAEKNYKAAQARDAMKKAPFWLIGLLLKLRTKIMRAWHKLKLHIKPIK